MSSFHKISSKIGRYLESARPCYNTILPYRQGIVEEMHPSRGPKKPTIFAFLSVI